MVIGAATHVGLVRARNEDAFLAVPGLLAVADGLGGHRAGEVASELAVRTILQVLSPGFRVQDMRNAVLLAHRRIAEMSRVEEDLIGMGTTLTVAGLSGSSIIVGHVGDSRAYILTKGSISQVTQDHSVVNELVRSGALTEQEARVHPRRHAITRSLGGEADPEVDLVECAVSPSDSVILCTDGLYSLIEPFEIAFAATEYPDPQACCDQLIATANARGGHDNITVVVARIESSDLCGQEPRRR